MIVRTTTLNLFSLLSSLPQNQKQMARTQKNKATSGHLGMLKAKLAKLRRELLDPVGGGGGGGGASRGDGFDVNKVGDARVGLVGFPSVGKSTLLNKLTGTFSEVAAYEFTTLTCVPGVIRYRGAKIQLLDLPGIIEGAKDGKGRGRQVISTARTCNLILIVLDCLKPLTHKRLIEHELEGFGIRLNKKPPAIGFRKKERGGVALTCTAQDTKLDLDTVKAVLSEYKIHNADVHVRDGKYWRMGSREVEKRGGKKLKRFSSKKREEKLTFFLSTFFQKKLKNKKNSQLRRRRPRGRHRGLSSVHPGDLHDQQGGPDLARGAAGDVAAAALLPGKRESEFFPGFLFSTLSSGAGIGATELFHSFHSSEAGKRREEAFFYCSFLRIPRANTSLSFSLSFPLFYSPKGLRLPRLEP